MELAYNTEKIRELIEGIKSLPPAGGGGGLPVGVSKLASGTFTPLADIEGGIYIAHDLGVEPNFYVVFDETDYSEGSEPGTPLISYALRKPFSERHWNTGEPQYYACFFIDIVFDYGEYINYNAYNSPADYGADMYDSYFVLYAPYLSDVYPFKAGHTYRWVCGVIDGVV